VLSKRALHRSLMRRPFSEGHVENSPPCHSRRAFGPSKRPFARLPLRACGPWVRIAPPLLSGLRQTLAFRATPSAPLAKVALGPTPSTAWSSQWAPAFGSALLTCCSPLAPAADALEEDGSEEPALPARTTGPRGEPSPAALAARAFWPPVPVPPFLDPSRDAQTFPAGQAPPTARPSLHQHTEGHAWGSTSRHRRSSGLDGTGLMAPCSPSARALRQTLWLPPNKGLHPTRAARGRVKPRSLGR
jgi:hypothetical protein